jgi:hypothetical protein
MAIGDKKSGLEPSSIQAQQYRLQFSNLESRAARTTTSGQAAQPISRPAVSTLAPSPAPPVPAPAPAPAVAQTAAAVSPTFRQAVFFDGATALSASLVGGNDVAYSKSPTLNALGIDLIFKPAAPDSFRHTILHTYSGSFMSQSLELYITGSKLFVEMTEGETTVNMQVVPHRWYTSTDLALGKLMGRTEHMTNQYTYYGLRMNPGNVNAIGVLLKTNTMPANSAFNSNLMIPGIPQDFNIANNTHFYIGGSPAKNSYFSGSIASITFTSGSFVTNQQWGDMSIRNLAPETVSPQLRTYTFNSTPVEVTGSQASFSRPLEVVTGSLTYVNSYLKA